MVLGNNTAIIVTLIFSVAFPFGMMIWWKKKTGEKIWSFVVGAIGFALFAMVLENLLHQVCLVNENAVSKAILGSPVLYTLYAAFAAGVFEETGRLFGFKVLLRKNHKNSCAVAYGIGHGGIEVLFILGASYLVLLLALLGVDFGSEATNAQMIATAQSISLTSAGITMFERVCAMMIQIGLSMLVFVAAREKKYLWLYPVAILIHAMIDAPAALYQHQVISSIFVVEGVAFVMGICCLYLGIKMLRRRSVAEV